MITCLSKFRNVTGLLRPLLFRVFSASYEENTSVVDGRDPFKIFRTPEREVAGQDVLLKRVISACKTGIPARKFGLSLIDMMNMDLATFNMIDEACAELLSDTNIATKDALEDLM